MEILTFPQLQIITFLSKTHLTVLYCTALTNCTVLNYSLQCSTGQYVQYKGVRCVPYNNITNGNHKLPKLNHNCVHILANALLNLYLTHVFQFHTVLDRREIYKVSDFYRRSGRVQI